MGNAQLVSRILVAGTVACAALAAPVRAQDSGFEGSVAIGYRTVDTGGAERKFRQDVNQEDGPILFGLELDLVPEGEIRNVADRIDLRLNDIGSEAFESFHLGVKKYGGYAFEYDRRESAYFYADFLEFTDPVHLDPRTFDFRRVRDTGSLEIELSPAASLTFGFEQYTKRGEGTTSLDVARDEFELDSVIDEELQTSRLGFSYAWDKVTLILEERLREYDNAVELFLPGFSAGEDAADAATLDFFFLNQPYDYTSNEHSVKVLARPTDRLDVRFSADIFDLDLNVNADERSQGTSFDGSPLATNLVGDGDIQRDVDLLNLEATYLLNDRWAILGEARVTNLDQNGEFVFGNVLRTGDWEIDTTSYRAGVQYVATEKLSLSGGLLFESRDALFLWTEGEAASNTEDVTSDSNGYFGLVSWHPAAGLDVSAEVDVSTIDDPFTLTSATDRTRYRARARYRWDTGLFLSASLQMKDYENDDSGWAADSTTATARVGYAANGLEASFGYSLLESEREIDQLVASTGARTDLFPIFYELDADTLDGRVRWAVSDRIAIGASVSVYDSDGSFGLEYEDYRAFVEYRFLDSYVAGLAYRTLDYDEADFDFDDYDADIVELSIGYRW